MELIKENETFRISDKKENGWEFEGSITRTREGNVNMDYRVYAKAVLESETPTMRDEIGSGFYSETPENKINSSYSVSKKDETEFIDYMQVNVAEVRRLLSAEKAI